MAMSFAEADLDPGSRGAILAMSLPQGNLKDMFKQHESKLLPMLHWSKLAELSAYEGNFPYGCGSKNRYHK